MRNLEMSNFWLHDIHHNAVKNPAIEVIFCSAATLIFWWLSSGGYPLGSSSRGCPLVVVLWWLSSRGCPLGLSSDGCPLGLSSGGCPLWLSSGVVLCGFSSVDCLL